MAAARKQASRPKRRISWSLVRRVFFGLLKGFMLFVLVTLVLSGLLSSEAEVGLRINALFIVVMMCISLAYLFYVSSHVWLDLPGIDEDDLKSDDGAATQGWKRAWQRMAGKLKGQTGRDVAPELTVTIQVPRLSSSASRVNIVNDAVLPVLRAESTLELTRDFEGDIASTDGALRQAKVSAFSIPARSTRRAALANAFDHVGIYRLRTATVRIHDLLGMLSVVRGKKGDWRVRVVPNIYHLPNGIPWDRKMSQTDLGIPDVPDDALDYDRVRDYQPGDPLKTIHWKLVAHSQGELLTKLFETPTVSTVTLMFDPYGLSDYYLYDTMLEGGFSLMEHAREIGFSGSVRFVNRDDSFVEMPWEGPGVLGWFVETAQRPSSTGMAEEQSVTAIQSLLDSPRGYVIYATSGLTERSVGALIACHQAGVHLLVVHAQPPKYRQEGLRQRSYDERLRRALIPVVSMSDGPQIVREVMAS